MNLKIIGILMLLMILLAGCTSSSNTVKNTSNVPIEYEKNVSDIEPKSDFSTEEKIYARIQDRLNSIYETRDNERNRIIVEKNIITDPEELKKQNEIIVAKPDGVLVHGFVWDLETKEDIKDATVIIEHSYSVKTDEKGYYKTYIKEDEGCLNTKCTFVIIAKGYDTYSFDQVATPKLYVVAAMTKK